MVVTQILHFLGRQPETMIALPLIAKSVLVPYSCEENSARDAAEPHQSQTDTEADRVRWSLAGDVYVARDNTAKIAKPDLEGRGNRALVVSRHVVRQPGESDRLRDVAATSDEVDCEVADANAEAFLG